MEVKYRSIDINNQDQFKSNQELVKKVKYLVRQEKTTMLLKARQYRISPAVARKMKKIHKSKLVYNYNKARLNTTQNHGRKHRQQIEFVDPDTINSVQNSDKIFKENLEDTVTNKVTDNDFNESTKDCSDLPKNTK